MLESAIQASITKRLTAAGWIVVKIIQCTRNGWPDLQAHKNGRTIFIEVKAQGGKARPLQHYRHAELRAHGFEVYITNDPDFTVN